MRARLTISARIALLSVALALLSNLVLVGFIWKQTSADAVAALHREIVEQADALRAVWRTGALPALADAIKEAREPGDVTLVLAIFDPQGHRIAGYAPRHLAVPLADTPFRIAVLGRDGVWASREAGYTLHPIGPDWLLVGRPLDLIEAQQVAIERALALAVALSLMLGIGTGLLLAHYVAGRLNTIVSVIDAAGEGDLSRRVSLVRAGNDANNSGGDAFDRLAERLNAMLGKIEQLMAELRVVTDSLAHDLRSPLARLRTKTEQAVLIADPHQREAALGGLLVETDLIMRMLTMVIEISRSESVTRDRFTLASPAELVEEIGELYAPLAEEAGIRFLIEIEVRPAPLPLHRELMSQALSNLIDNALKHGGSGGQVTLRLSEAVDGIIFQVEDRGPGIAQADRAQALKRFGRLDAARTTPGAGLGMALIEAVARLHGGRFELGDNAPGLIARLVIP
ncbi:HAMP domain-containing sensor histidine kinase [uncultured Sphingomonas sp.]|uniref:sensor histidine kinase n=1 Tax=uncultured Sphingomonas sp. TaxID=158754 RepID=UPI0025F9E1A7|nr:HAMP domain-containing sensor histidine kinase [uncultured Sphingomonas sp.]